MAWIPIIASLLTLFGKIVSEIFSAKARARKRDEKFEFDKKIFLGMVDKIILEERTILANESRDARTVEDRMSDDLKR